MLFDLLVPERILFGPGCTGRLGEEARRLGRRALLVTGRSSLQESGMIDRILAPLWTAGVEVVPFYQVDPEPAVAAVQAARETARSEGVDLIIGAGGGSALDVAKAAAGLFNETGQVGDYLAGRPLEKPGIPWIAVPTTAGSGAEATNNSVLIEPDRGKKHSLRSDLLMARIAVVDPVLTMTMPRKLTAITGFDALTHALESFTSRWAHPVTEALSLQAVLLICRNIYSAYNKRSKDAREKMSMGSMMAGLALNNARAGAVHALAHPVGLRYHLPHGLVCGILLPWVMEYNLNLVEDKYARIARELNLVPWDADSRTAAEKLVHFIRRMLQRLGLPQKLGEVGLQREDILGLAQSSLGTGSLAANPRAATVRDLEGILLAGL